MFGGQHDGQEVWQPIRRHSRHLRCDAARLHEIARRWVPLAYHLLVYGLRVPRVDGNRRPNDTDLLPPRRRTDTVTGHPTKER